MLLAEMRASEVILVNGCHSKYVSPGSGKSLYDEQRFEPPHLLFLDAFY